MTIGAVGRTGNPVGMTMQEFFDSRATITNCPQGIISLPSQRSIKILEIMRINFGNQCHSPEILSVLA